MTFFTVFIHDNFSDLFDQNHLIFSKHKLINFYNLLGIHLDSRLQVVQETSSFIVTK